MAALFARLGATVTGVDITPGFDAAASAEAERQGLSERLRFMTDDGRLASVADETFDVVFTKSVLVMVPDRPTYLDAIADRLRPGGRFGGLSEYLRWLEFHVP